MNKSTVFSGLHRIRSSYRMDDDGETTSTDISIQVETEVASAEEETTEVEEAIEATDEIVEESDTTISDIEMVQHQINTINKYGLNRGMFALIDKDNGFSNYINKISKNNISVESINKHSSHDQQTIIALEGLKSAAGALWQRIVEFFKRIGTFVKDLIDKVLAKFFSKTKNIENMLAAYKDIRGTISLGDKLEVLTEAISGSAFNDLVDFVDFNIKLDNFNRKASESEKQMFKTFGIILNDDDSVTVVKPPIVDRSTITSIDASTIVKQLDNAKKFLEKAKQLKQVKDNFNRIVKEGIDAANIAAKESGENAGEKAKELQNMAKAMLSSVKQIISIGNQQVNCLLAVAAAGAKAYKNKDK